MTREEQLYHEAAQKNTDADPGQMFGKPCYKINGKAFIAFFQDCMVFKLAGDAHASALALKGAKLFDPSGKGRAMKEWVQVPATSSSEWDRLSRLACTYVSTSVK